METVKGRILLGTGGFYYVETSGGLLETRARGLFRKRGISPCAGDFVMVEAEGKTGYITEILPRKNDFVRPALSNLDRLLIVVSAVDPVPNLEVIDRLTAIAALKEIETVLIFTKADLSNVEEYAHIYRHAGFPVFVVDYETGGGLCELRALTDEGINAVIGNSGVGKSTLLNALYPELTLKTGETSKKLGRGKHTTRTVELHRTRNGYLADTPGFSTVDVFRYEKILRDDCERAFPEFAPFLGECRFTGCSHRTEKGCAVLAAVQEGKIEPSRHGSYRALYDEAMQIKEWELTKKE